MRLELLSGPRSGQRVEVGDELTVGRDPRSGLVLDEGKVSRHHATLRVDHGRLVVTDTGSRNGTWVNGERVEARRELEDGDRVRIGDSEMRVELDAPKPEADVPHVEPPPRRRSRLTRSKGTTTLLRTMEGRLRRVTLLAALAVIAGISVAVLALAGVFEQQQPGVADATKKATPSTIYVETEPNARGESSSGSGWVLDARRGLVVTNFHVVDGSPGFKVRSAGAWHKATLAGGAPCEDLAVLRVDRPAGLKTLPTLPHQSQLHDGDTVATLGYPVTPAKGAPLVASAGVVSTARTSIPAYTTTGGVHVPTEHDYVDLIQYDAGLNHGNSGGPLIDVHGRLVGVNTLGYGREAFKKGGLERQTERQNFAIGVDRVHQVVPQLAAGQSLAFTGAYLDFPSGADVNRVGFPYAIVSGTVPGSWADRNGVTAGSFITGVNGRRLSEATLHAWCKAVGYRTTAHVARLSTVSANGQAHTFDVRL